ncbi:MAG: hypothetical protein HY291_14740 [Planctomycetes bacterium]|nr:hypothetical protein [Planctomycetota bacterium]
MKNIYLLGLVLVVLGTLGLVYDKIGFKTKEQVAEIGPIEIQKEKEHKLEIPQAAGILLVAAGMVVIIYGSRRGH